jgi:hypothetical protein
VSVAQVNEIKASGISRSFISKSLPPPLSSSGDFLMKRMVNELHYFFVAKHRYAPLASYRKTDRPTNAILEQNCVAGSCLSNPKSADFRGVAKALHQWEKARGDWPALHKRLLAFKFIRTWPLLSSLDIDWLFSLNHDEYTNSNYHNSEHRPSSCLLFKARRFGDRTMDNVQNGYINIPSSQSHR